MSFPKCQQCPQDDQKEEYPPPPSNPSLITLECGHQIHFHCYRNSFYKSHSVTDNFCTECQEPLHNSEVEDFFHEPDLGVDVPLLWNSNPTFQEKIKELFQAEKDYYKEKGKYIKSANKINREYKKNIKINLALIRIEKKKANKSLRSVVNRNSYKNKLKKYYNLFHDMIDEYKICINDLQSNLPPSVGRFNIDSSLMWKNNKKLKNPDYDLNLVPFKYSYTLI